MKSFVSAPILRPFDPEGKPVVETDTSNLVIVRVLSQCDDDDILHPWLISPGSIPQPRLIMRFMTKNFLQLSRLSENGAPF
jgi:hypothetical protein